MDADAEVSLMLADHRILESDQLCIGGGGLLESGFVHVGKTARITHAGTQSVYHIETIVNEQSMYSLRRGHLPKVVNWHLRT